MQFVFLLLFNVFLGAVLYLVISLKLERSATEFRERRFRKEMDEIIKEFNTTAERNISLLESRIRLLRRLMEKTGDIRSLDITLEEEKIDDADGACVTAGELPVPGVREVQNDSRGEISAAGVAPGERNNGGALIKKGLLILFEKLIDILPLRKASGSTDFDMGHTAAMPAANEAQEEAVPVRDRIPAAGRAIIEKDMTMIMPAEPEKPEEKRRILTADEIEEIVAASDDRYKLVSVLFDGGCAIEDISRYSGIPAGEVRLVLNLNRGRDMSGA